MPEAIVVLAALTPGVLLSLAVVAIARAGGMPPAIPPAIERAGSELVGDRLAAGRRRIALQIARAGWRESPERLAVITVALSAALGALGLGSVILADAATAISLGVGCASAGVAMVALSLRASVRGRRKRLVRELSPLLELFVLELGGGGSAISALGSVTLQLEGELADELRRLLIASQVSGSASFESRLRAYAENMGLPALASLATILTASREYGTGVTQGVRALAADLRRAQRRELIAHSRRALNHVLFPAAIGVLLPFLAILLYPAVTTLQRSLR